jgi:hypothetical protein
VPYEDPESGKKYYVDPKTGESIWEVSAGNWKPSPRAEMRTAAPAPVALGGWVSDGS